MWIPIALIALTAPVQELTDTVQEQEQASMHYFTPDEAHLMELYEQARDLFRRPVPRPGGNPRDGYADNLFLLGDSIVVYDSPEYSDTVLRSLEEMQNAWRKQSDQVAASQELVMQELRVTNLSAFEAYQALTQLERQVFAPDNAREPFSNVKYIQGSELLVLRDTPEKVDSMRTLIERLDRPAPQVQLSFLLVRAHPVDTGSAPEHDPRVPAALTDALAAMLPHMSLGLESSALLRTSVRGGVERDVFLPVEGGRGRFSVNFRLGALDERAGMLSVPRCELTYVNEVEEVTSCFSTGTSIPIGEYVVIGSNGASPTLLVLRAVSADQAPRRSEPAKGFAR